MHADPEDGNSMDKICNPLGGDGATCIPGCYPAGQQCPDVRHEWSCSFPPTHLREALQAQELRFLARNNEMVVDLRSVERNLPDAIAGFFYCARSGTSEIQRVQKARADFLAHYGLSSERGPPLLVLDLSLAGGVRPFTVSPLR
jgi:hypothetical protein